MSHHDWTDVELEILLAQYPVAPSADLADLLRVPLEEVHRKARECDLLPPQAARRAELFSQLRLPRVPAPLLLASAPGIVGVRLHRMAG